jgi:hypothetical protein
MSGTRTASCNLGLLMDHHGVDVDAAWRSSPALMEYAVQTCMLCRNHEAVLRKIEQRRPIGDLCPNAEVFPRLPKRRAA